MERLFKWRRRGGQHYFHETDVGDLLGAVKSGNRMSALRKAVGIIDRSVNDLPTGINKHTPVAFDNDPKRLGQYADELQAWASSVEMKLGRDKVAEGSVGADKKKRQPTPAQIQTHTKNVEALEKIEADAEKLDEKKPDDKKKLDALHKDQTAIQAKVDKFDEDYPDFEPETDDVPDTSGMPSSGEEGVGAVTWILVLELVYMVIQIIRDFQNKNT